MAPPHPARHNPHITPPHRRPPMSDANTTPPAAQPDPNDPLALAELFAGGGGWGLPAHNPVMEARRSPPPFIAPKRSPRVVPARELPSQALKPTPPHKWKVVVFGQNPYPRAESATGI